MIKNPSNKLQITENYALGMADVFLAYTMLSPIIFIIIGEHIKLVPNFFRTIIILLGPGLVAFVIYFRINGIQTLKSSKWILSCMMLFVLVVLISSLKHIDTELTKESLKFFIGYCIFGFSLGALSNMSVRRSRQLFSIWLVFIVGFLIYTVCRYWPIVNQRIFNETSGINNAQIGASFYFFTLCILFKFGLPTKLIKKIGILASLLACFLIGFYSGTRTAFFGFLISLIIYLFYYSHVKLNKLYPLVIVCFIILAFFVLLPYVNKFLRTRYLNAFEMAKNVVMFEKPNDSSGFSSNIRHRIWKNALDKFKNNPVLGAGFGISYPDKKTGIDFVHPHNFILELLAETGVVGFSVFAIFFGLIFKRAVAIYKQLSGDSRMIFLFYPLSLVFFFLYSSLHTDLSTEYFKWYFAGMITGFQVDSNEQTQPTA